MRAGSAVGGGGREAAAGGGRAAATRFLSPTGAPLHGGCRGRPQITGRGLSPLPPSFPPPPRPPPCPPGPRRPSCSPQVRDGGGRLVPAGPGRGRALGTPGRCPRGSAAAAGACRGSAVLAVGPRGRAAGPGRGRAGGAPRLPGLVPPQPERGARLCPAAGPAVSWGSAAPQLGEGARMWCKKFSCPVCLAFPDKLSLSRGVERVCC